MAILDVLLGVLKFWEPVKVLIGILSKTPEEKHLDLMDRIRKESEAYAKPDGRPDWS
jgi:hypothetical protein